MFTAVECREHGVVGDMRDAWPSARVRKNVSLIRTYHGFKGTTLMLLHWEVDSVQSPNWVVVHSIDLDCSMLIRSSKL